MDTIDAARATGARYRRSAPPGNPIGVAHSRVAGMGRPGNCQIERYKSRHGNS